MVAGQHVAAQRLRDVWKVDFSSVMDADVDDDMTTLAQRWEERRLQREAGVVTAYDDPHA